MTSRKSPSPKLQRLTVTLSVVGAVTGIIGAVAGLHGSIESGKSARILRQLELQDHLDRSWRNLGGGLGSRVIFKLTTTTTELDLAAAHIRQAEILDPTSSLVQRNKAYLLRATGRDHEALAELETALASKPGAVDLHLARGWILLDQARPSAAAKAFQAGLEHDDRCLECFLGLGWSSLEGSDANSAKAATEAEFLFRKAISINFSNAHAFAGLWTSLRLQGRGSEAEDAARKALTLDPNVTIRRRGDSTKHAFFLREIQAEMRSQVASTSSPQLQRAAELVAEQ